MAKCLVRVGLKGGSLFEFTNAHVLLKLCNEHTRLCKGPVTDLRECTLCCSPCRFMRAVSS